MFRKILNSAPISPLLLNTYSFEVAVPPLIASSLGSDGIEDGLMVGMLVLGGGGGGGHGMVVVPKFVEQIDPFWNLVYSQRGTEGLRLLGGTFQLPVVVVKGPEGSHLLVGPNLGLVLAATGSEGLCVFVSCQNLWGTWGIRIRAQDVHRAPY